MIKKAINKLKYLYSKRDMGIKYIYININVFLERKKSKILRVLSFPFRAMKALRNILFGYLFKNIKYIGKENYLQTKNDKKIAICIGFTEWKREYFQEYILDYDAIYLHNYIPTIIIAPILKQLGTKYEVFIWSYQERETLLNFFKLNNVPVKRVEDGFVRSIGLGANQTKPLSLVIDNEDLYFNAQKQSGLETIIFEHAQAYSKKELNIARQYIDEINLKKITKYNFKNVTPIDNLQMYINSQKKTILVIGQVEDDMSIKLGTQTTVDNLDLLKLAYEENMDCNIIFKPHPDILHKKRNNKVELDEYLKYALVVTDNIALFDLIALSDHVYTITSLSGFEALLQGKKVTCIGSPFYAHWGLTDDRDKVIERRRDYSLSIEQLFYASYIEYPIYLLGDLSKTIESIVEFEHAAEFTFNDKFKFFNSNLESINNEALLKEFTDKKIAIITTSEKISKLYTGVKSISKSTTILTLTNAETNKIIETKLVNPKDVIWLGRAYAAPLSIVEKQAVEMTNRVSETYPILLSSFTDNIFSEETKEKLISAIRLGFEDRIYDQCAIIESLKFLSEDYDKLLIYIDPYEKVKVFTDLLLSNITDDKIVFVSNKNKKLKNFRSFIEDRGQIKNLIYWAKKDVVSIDKYRREFKKIWHEFLIPTISDKKNEFENKDCNTAIIIGNLVDRNYAYYPSSIELINILDKLGIELEFLASHRINEKSVNHYKWLLFEIPSRIKLLDTRNTLSDKKIISKMKAEIEFTTKSILSSLESKFSLEIKNYLRENIIRALEELPYQLLFFSKALALSKNSNIVITTMDRSVYSRLTTIAAQSNGKKTIGVQPQVISNSIRYKKPEVDYMCVIDEMQKNNYNDLGFNRDKMFNVGSANLRKHLQQIDNEPVLSELENQDITSMLFIMQHSMSTVMINIIIQLLDVFKNGDYILYIKPHPHQEKSTILKVAALIEKFENIILLSADDNTYTYIKNCNIIIGLFSSAVFEAMLSGKDVLILKDEELDKSIDFSQLNISLSSNIRDDIEGMIMNYVNNSSLAQKVRKNRDNFILNSKYYYSDCELTTNIKKWSNL